MAASTVSDSSPTPSTTTTSPQVNGDGAPQLERLDRFEKEHKDYVHGLAFSPDGRLLATASGDHTAVVTEVLTGRTVHSLTHTTPVNSASWTRDGSRVVFACYDGDIVIAGKQSPASAWTSNTVYRHGKLTYHAVFSPDDRWLAVGVVDQGVVILDVNKGFQAVARVRGFGSLVCCVTFSPDGRFLAAVDYVGTVVVCDAQNGQWTARANFDAVAEFGHYHPIAFSPDSMWLAVGSETNTVSVWPVPAVKTRWPPSKPIVLKGHTDQVRSVVFLHDSRQVMTAARDSTVRVWSLPDGRQLLNVLADDRVLCLDYSAQTGCVAAGLRDKSGVQLWRIHGTGVVRAAGWGDEDGSRGARQRLAGLQEQLKGKKAKVDDLRKHLDHVIEQEKEMAARIAAITAEVDRLTAERAGVEINLVALRSGESMGALAAQQTELSLLASRCADLEEQIQNLDARLPSGLRDLSPADLALWVGDLDGGLAEALHEPLRHLSGGSLLTMTAKDLESPPIGATFADACRLLLHCYELQHALAPLPSLPLPTGMLGWNEDEAGAWLSRSDRFAFLTQARWTGACLSSLTEERVAAAAQQFGRALSASDCTDLLTMIKEEKERQVAAGDALAWTVKWTASLPLIALPQCAAATAAASGIDYQKEVERIKAEMKALRRTIGTAPPDGAVCFVTGEVMEDPVVAADGVVYERAAMLDRFSKGDYSSPEDGKPLVSTTLTPSRATRKLIDSWAGPHASSAK